MKRLLNTLFVTTQGAHLAREGETVLVRIEQETRLRVPILTLGGIVCFGQVSASPPLMGFCAERGVALSFFTEYGRFLARVEGPVSGNVLLRREQYRRAENIEARGTLARAFVAGKLINARNALLRAARDRSDLAAADPLRAGAEAIQQDLQRLGRPAYATDLDGIRGVEGDAAREYFARFDQLVLAQKDDFAFTERSRRPPLDPLNALLSFVYTLLTHDCAAALGGVGFDPQVGFLHADRPGRPGLALDLMEEFRPWLADRLVLALINRRQITAKGFTRGESGEFRMNDATRKAVLVAWQERKQEEILHPFLNEKASIGLLPHLQALLLARHLRGDLDAYPPFIWK